MSPSLIVSLLIAAGLALAYHLWRGGGFGRLVMSILVAIAGFLAGQLIGQLFGWQLLMLGEVHLAEGLIGALIAIVIVNRPD